MVKKFLDQKVGARIFEARNERTVTGTSAKSRSKGKSVRVERKQGDCFLWKAKGKCTTGDSCTFRHDHSKRGASTRSSPPSLKSQTNNEGNNSSKGKPPRGSGPSGNRLQKLCKDYNKGTCTNPSYDSRHLPVCQN